MIDKKYYDILNMITKENIFEKCFDFLQKNGVDLENRNLNLIKYTNLNDSFYNLIKTNKIWNYLLWIENDDFYFDKTKKSKKINKMINHFIKNNNFSNEFFENPICW